MLPEKLDLHAMTFKINKSEYNMTKTKRFCDSLVKGK